MSRKEENEAREWALRFLRTFYFKVKFVDKYYDIDADKDKIELKVASISIKNGYEHYRQGYFNLEEKDFSKDFNYFLFCIDMRPLCNLSSYYQFILLPINIIRDKFKDVKPNKYGERRKQVTINQLYTLMRDNN